jgi:hypothetical protein
MGVIVAEAKGKVRARHEEAIKQFQAWCKRHPEADKRRTIAQFNALVDSAALQIEIERELRRNSKVHAK